MNCTKEYRIDEENFTVSFGGVDGLYPPRLVFRIDPNYVIEMGFRHIGGEIERAFKAGYSAATIGKLVESGEPDIVDFD